MNYFILRDLQYSKDFIFQFLPILLILIIIILKNKRENSLSSVLISFCLGISIHYPLDLLIHLAQLFQYNYIESEKAIFFYTAFFRAAYLEESLKFIIIYYFCIKYQEYEKPSETFVYAISVALGYAVYENLFYYKFYNIGLEKRFVVIFAHMGFAMLMSLFLSKSMFSAIETVYEKNYIKGPIGIFYPVIFKKTYYKSKFYFSKRIAIFLSLALPILFHGLWNILLMLKLYDYHQYLIYFNYLFILVIIIYLRYCKTSEVQKYQKRSAIKNSDVQLNFIYVLILTSVTIIVLSSYFK